MNINTNRNAVLPLLWTVLVLSCGEAPQEDSAINQSQDAAPTLFRTATPLPVIHPSAPAHSPTPTPIPTPRPSPTPSPNPSPAPCTPVTEDGVTTLSIAGDCTFDENFSVDYLIFDSGTIDGSATLTVNIEIEVYEGTVNTSLSGAAKLVKNGSGEVTLNAPNSYTGGTFVDSGNLVLGNPEALPSGSSLNIGGGGTVIF